MTTARQGMSKPKPVANVMKQQLNIRLTVRPVIRKYPVVMSVFTNMFAPEVIRPEVQGQAVTENIRNAIARLAISGMQKAGYVFVREQTGAH